MDALDYFRAKRAGARTRMAWVVAASLVHLVLFVLLDYVTQSYYSAVGYAAFTGPYSPISAFHLPGIMCLERAIDFLPTSRHPHSPRWACLYVLGWVLVGGGSLGVGIGSTILWKWGFRRDGADSMWARLALLAMWAAVVPWQFGSLYENIAKLARGEFY